MVSPDTEIALLLCGRFAKESTGPKPLSPGEWNKLAAWLKQRKLRPVDLHQTVAEKPDLFPLALERVQNLLGRGMAMSIALERWGQFGIWVLGRSDPGYPGFWRQRLKESSPPFVFGVGERSLIGLGGLAVVGSRQIDAVGLKFSESLGVQCAGQHLSIISGGAKGVDRAAMLASLAAGGRAVGILAHGLTRGATSRDWRDAIRDRRLALLSAVSPDAGFNVGAAMGRNKLIYAMANAAVVVHSAEGSGGTWTGALENLSGSWVPLYVRQCESVGNLALIARGARPLPAEVLYEDFQINSLAARTPDLQSAQSPGDALFVSFLNLLTVELERKPSTEAELGRTFDLEPAQLRYWLNLAKSMDKIFLLSDGRLSASLEESRTLEAEQLTLSDSLAVAAQ